MGLLDLKLKKDIELLKAEVEEWKSNYNEEHRLRTEDQERWIKAEAKIGTLESNESSLKSWLSLAEAKVKVLKDELDQQVCSVFFHDDLLDQNMKLRRLLRQAQPGEQESPSLFHQIRDVLKDNNSFTSKDKHELEEENRLVSEQNKVLNDTLLSMEKELSERLSDEELADIQEEHYIAWQSEKEARIHWSELWKKGCMALIGEQAKVVELREALIGLIGVADRTPCWCMSGHPSSSPHEDHCIVAGKALASSTDAGKIKARWVAEARAKALHQAEQIAETWGSNVTVMEQIRKIKEIAEAEAERLTSEDK